jgi:hypothetical protein
LFDLFMAPSSQELEPPPNPGRFSTQPGPLLLGHGIALSSKD